MSPGEEVEAAADVATGAVLARAVEPAAGEGKSGSDASCSNCGAVLSTAYCSACGQKAKVHRTLGAFAHDALHSVLHFDGKIWRTLPLLAWHPGQLTRRYVLGERAKFVSPLALFLFSVFLAFAVFGWVLPKAEAGSGNSIETIDKELAAAREEITAQIKALEAERDSAGDKTASAAIDTVIAGVRQGAATAEAKTLERLRLAKAMEARIGAEKSRTEASVAALESQLAQARQAGAETQEMQTRLAEERAYQQLMARAAEIARTEGVGGPRVRISLGNENLNIAVSEAAKNPQLLLYKIQSNAYKFAWALIPISVPFVWLLFFWKREFKWFDHAVFVTYSLCFMLTLATVVAVMMQFRALDTAGGLCMVFVPPLHMYRHVRHAYGLSHWAAAWRTTALLGFAATALGLFGFLVVALGVSA